ncbi:GntR family transcriptional regulator [Companilactobacillus keshanensis]|uniref:GntR family transcriptional regulator n=1 Tax=Companilactobacillus keshanensis TaxID=2486003 RepID=A0ABW4BSQ5_9LACO|nr:GntR family transcriptional regulator [Companilactobacillus keshanensis]
MNFDDKIPIYYQIKNHLYYQIVAGTLAPGVKLPSVRQLAVDVTANVNTVQHALTEMLDEKIIESKRGKGNFVTEDIDSIKQLKDKLVIEQISLSYKKLHALSLTDTEIITEFKKYMKNRSDIND